MKVELHSTSFYLTYQIDSHLVLKIQAFFEPILFTLLFKPHLTNYQHPNPLQGRIARILLVKDSANLVTEAEILKNSLTILRSIDLFGRELDMTEMRILALDQIKSLNI